MTPAGPVFALPDRLAAKRDPRLIGDDERHLATVAARLATTVAGLEFRLTELRLSPGGSGQEALDRDLEIHRLSGELGLLRRHGMDLCLGRMVPDGGDPVYIGRIGMTDAEGNRILVDWRSPAAAPFFGATHGDPMGLASRRRYRWSAGRIVDYWDEAFTEESLREEAASLDDQSAFIASLGSSRSERMRDVLGTIQADQDAIIRADSRGALVVDGGPGTGKTVVALHRAAYLLYADARVARRHGGVLVIGPSPAYLRYVGDVLPSLGEEGVQTCTLRDLVPEGATAVPEADPRVAALKADARLAEAVTNAVRRYEQPPAQGMRVRTEWGDAILSPDDWADAFASAEPGTPHDDAREEVWDVLVELVADQVGADPEELGIHLRGGDLRRAFTRTWPLLDPPGVVADLLSVPAYLRACAPWLSADEVASLTRTDGRAWTTSDLPLLDAARHLIGDPRGAEVARRREQALRSQREVMDRVVDDLIAGDDSELLVSQMLSGSDAQNSLIDASALPALDPDALAGPFAHVVVDEAQELTDAEWAMVIRRTPAKSLTIVGDRAQARRGFAESWQDRLARVGLTSVGLAGLTINYRTPVEVMAEAAPVIRAALPDANVPTSVRESGIPVLHAPVAERDRVVGEWLDTHDEGVAVVIGDPSFAGVARVASLDPVAAKGLEFDLVVLVEPERFGEGISGAVDRYVAMTRATQQLVVLAG